MRTLEYPRARREILRLGLRPTERSYVAQRPDGSLRALSASLRRQMVVMVAEGCWPGFQVDPRGRIVRTEEPR